MVLLDCIMIYQFLTYFILMNFLEIRSMNFLEKRLTKKRHIQKTFSAGEEKGLLFQ